MGWWIHARKSNIFFLNIKLSTTHYGFKFKILNQSVFVKLHTADEFLQVGLGEFIDS